jgi:hypothetical protein
MDVCAEFSICNTNVFVFEFQFYFYPKGYEERIDAWRLGLWSLEHKHLADLYDNQGGALP